MPCSRQTPETARTLAMDTGWPPPELLVTVSMQSGMRSRPTSAISRRSALDIHVPLERMAGRGDPALRESPDRGPRPR